MTIDEIISQLEDLRRDRESFLDGDDDEIYQADIEAIDNAIKAMDIAANVAKENVELKRLLRLASSEVHRPYPEYIYRFELEAEKIIGGENNEWRQS